ncbi:MAG: ComEC/Rec2 family competence protein [Bacteroidota bacterium]
MRRYGIEFWRAAPFIRLLIPLIAGIVLGQYGKPPLPYLGIIVAICMSGIVSFRFLPASHKYKWRWVNGGCFTLFIICGGSMLMHHRNITYQNNWVGNYITQSAAISLRLQEPLVEKPNSYKALASVTSVYHNQQWRPAKGNVLLYFRKDSIAPPLQYGSIIIIQKPLQPITNSGNPGGFDYRQYCAFQDIYYQVYLQRNDFLQTNERSKNALGQLLINTRTNVLSIFRQWVPGQIETGVAEALLIGYRDDLDKDLVRAYSNTGVVHIIAISGLHLGMIYGLMLALLKPFRNQKWMRWLKPLLILLVLWGFSLLAGAVASILRSVVMFSFIVIGESLGRRTNIYNTLAASAFCLLIYDPYFFWDVGFQLSYTAVLSIVLFMKPIYRCCYFQNKLLNTIWELNAITLAAQILTLPIILYYFHQFPNLFLITNFIAVPLSGFILYGELVLLLVYKIPYVNLYTGKSISFLIHQMNLFIERTNQLPFSVTDQVNISLTQTLLLYFTIVLLAWWILQRKTIGLLVGSSFLLVFFIIRSVTLINQRQQQKLIVYNIPKHSAIDIIQGQSFVFWGDDTLRNQNFLQNFHLLPSRVLNGVKESGSLPEQLIHYPLIAGSQKTVLVIAPSFRVPSPQQKIPVDLIILTGNPGIYLSQLAAVFDCSQYIFDSSNPLWKIRYWKKDAESLHLRHHTISEQGAFEVEL